MKKPSHAWHERVDGQSKTVVAHDLARNDLIGRTEA